MTEEKKTTEEAVTVPDEIKDFVGLLRDHEIKEKRAVAISKFIAKTGSDKVFEEPEELANFLGRWPRDLAPIQRRRILEQWFAERGVVVPEELLTKTSMHTAELNREEKKEALSKKLEEGRVWTIRDNKPALAHEGELATSLDEVKAALRELTGDEAIVTYDEKTGKHVPNFKSEFVRKNPMIAIQTARQYDQLLAAGETARDPLDIFFDQFAAFEQRRELLGMNPPKKEASTVSEIITGIKELDNLRGAPGKGVDTISELLAGIKELDGLRGTGQDDTLKEVREELTKVREDMHQAELRHKDEQLAQLAGTVQGYRNEVSQLRSDVEQNKQITGRSAYDLLGDALSKVPDKEDIRQMVSELATKGMNLQPRSPAERGKVLEKMATNIEEAAEVKAVEDMWFKWK